jgi:gliding motility-associated-like protein
MRKFLLLLLVLSLTYTGFAQDFSNKGKDFWVGYGYHVSMFGSATGGSQQMVLYFATDQVTNITISIPGLGYTQNLVSPAGNNVLTSAVIPKTGLQDAKLLVEGLSNKGIHITSDRPMVCYAHIYNASISGATILFPTNTLGKEYYSVNYKNWSNSANSNCWFYIIATDTGSTRVEITPTGNTTGGMIAGQTYTVNLNQGEVYNVMGSLINSPANCTPVCTGFDLTGSVIKSINTGAGCKKIAVFSGSGKLSITCNNNNSSADNYMAQALPKTAWGKKYLTVPAAGNQAYNIYRICVSDPTTVVKVNGVVTALPLQGNFYYELASTNQPQLIEGDKPILVAQYFTSQGACTNGTPGDPEVIYLSPVEQNINTVLWNATPFNAITAHFYNVVVPNTGTAISSFTLDGVSVPPSSFVVHPRDATYSYLKQPVSGGQHIIRSDSGFNAIAYGFGNAESYGYNAGTNIKDLYQQIGIISQYGIETTPSVCSGSPFKFKVSLPYIPDSMYWNFYGATGMTPNNTNIMVNNVGNIDLDSTTVVNGKTIYWYSLPLQYNFSTVGVFPVTISTYVPNADCGSVQDIDFDLTVSAPPVANFSWVSSGCVAEAVQFTETTPQTPKPTYRFWWDFNDPASGANNTSTLRNPTHLFSAPGIYNVRFSDITTPGCLSDTIIRQVIIAPLPSASISGTTAVCLNAPAPVITFTATGGTAPYTFVYNINGGANQTINTASGSTVSITAPTNVAGIFNYNLVSVNNSGSTACIQNQTGAAVVTVNPLPAATITGNATVCLNADMPLVTFTGAAGTAPYTFSYNINGGATIQATTNSGNSITVAVPTTTAGSFTYNLLSVQDGTPTACNQLQSGSITVLVKALPTAAISGNTSLCLNAAAPNITFTAAGGLPPYTFTYTLNGGTNQTVTTSTGNTVTVPAATNVAGTFIYNLVSVREGSANTCTQLQTGTATIVVNPLPTATVSGGTSVCLNAASPLITFTGAGSTAPYTFTYTINGGPNQTVTTTTGNSVTVAAPTNIAGIFNYTLISVQDGSSTGCTQAQTGAASIIIKPLPTATIAGTTSACLNGASPNISFTGATGTAPYTFTYTLDGGASSQTVTSTSGNGVSVPVPTTAVGTITYSLISVQEGSANTCVQNQIGTAVVTINPLPVATISGSSAVCLNTSAPQILFSGSAGTAPYTFTYNINGGPGQTVTTTSGNTVSVAAPTNIAGSFTYTLMSVRDASASVCSQAQTGSATIIVHPLPSAAFSFTNPTCATRLIVFSDNSVANIGTITTWSWNFGDPLSGANNLSNQQNPEHVFSAADTYPVSLIVSTSNGCSNLIFTRPVVVNSRPVAGYIVPEVCLSDTYAQFTDTSTVSPGTITAWAWNFGDGNATPSNPNTSALQNPTHSYTAIGSYIVQLIATSNNGCKDTISHTLVVNGSFPIANFTVNNPSTLCANDSVAIVNTSTVFPGVITKVEIYWDNASFPAVFQTDDMPFTGKIYRHLYPNFQSPLTKTFTIRYRAYSGGICVNDKVSNITVNAAPKVRFTALTDICLDASPYQVTTAQASETGGVPGTFVFSGPGISPSGLFNPAVAGVGTHSIKYTFTAAAAGCADSLSQTIKVLDSATSRFSFTLPVCIGSAATFREESIAPAGINISNSTWNFGDGSPVETHAPGSTVSHVFPAWGSYIVSMFTTSANGCNSIPQAKSIFISPAPQANFNFVQSTACLPAAIISFVNTSSIADGTENAFTYLWNFGDPASGALNTSVAKNPAPHIYNTAGPFTVTLTVTSGSNCVHTFSRIIDFIHPQPKAAFDFNKPGVCVGDNVTFRDLSSGADGTVSQWNWVFGDGNASMLNAPVHTYATAGTYNVSLHIINSFGCNSDTVTRPFIVYPYPVVSAGPDRVVLQGGLLSLQAVASGNNLQYLWTPATYLNNTSLSIPTASNVQDDITYTLTVTASGGCKSSDNMFVKVLKAPNIPNTFSPNGDGINEIWTIEYLDSYPDNRVQVFTRAGQLVFESRGYKTAWNGTMNGKILPTDTYYYIIEPGTGRKPMTGYVTILK